jgi:hypothetical protein
MTEVNNALADHVMLLRPLARQLLVFMFSCRSHRRAFDRSYRLFIAPTHAKHTESIRHTQENIPLIDRMHHEARPTRRERPKTP